MTKTSQSVFIELNEVKFVPRKSSEPEGMQRFLTLHDARVKEDEEKELVAETTGVETREEQVLRRDLLNRQVHPSSYRPASLPPPRRLEEENEDLPSFEDGYYIQKRQFRRHHSKYEQINWSITNVELLSNRKLRRQLQREAELEKRKAEEEAKRMEQELKET